MSAGVRALCVALVVALASCGFVRGYHGNVDGARVAIIGDSITWLAVDELDDALMPDYSIILDYGVGLRMGQMYGRLVVEVARNPDYVVVNIGSNDALQNWPTMLTDFAAEWRAVANRRCVVLVTITHQIEVTTRNGATARLNAAIRAKASEPNVVLVDWANIVAMYVAAGRVTEILSDGVHPTLWGQQVLARSYRDALRRCPAAN